MSVVPGRAVGGRWARLRPAIVFSVVMLAAGLLHGPVLRDGVTLGAAPAQLKLPFGYILLAPLCAVWDALSLLTAQQHLWLINSTLLLSALAGAWWPRADTRWTRRLRGGLIGGVVALLTIVVVYAAGALLPRPMAAITLTARDDLAIDFHSHTDASWDGRRWFGLSDRRDWHSEAGFNVAYITEHSTATVTGGSVGNPARAGDSLVLLRGVELACGGPHLIWLGATPEFAASHCSKEGVRAGPSDGGAPVIALATLPADLAQVRATAGLAGVELVDAAPRALDQLARDRGAIVGLAAARHIGVVASSNNHGWGRTSACWSVMTIPGWRDMSPSALDGAIRRALATDPEHAVRVIERRGPSAAISDAELATSAPEFAWNLLTGLSLLERLAWVGWIWALVGLAAMLRRWRSARSTRHLTLAR